MEKEQGQPKHTPDLLEAIQAERTREHRGGRFGFVPTEELSEKLQRRKFTLESLRLKREMDELYEEAIKIKNSRRLPEDR